MQVGGCVIVVTGGGNGIGAALCRRFADEGAKSVIVADRDGPAAARVASEIGGTSAHIDVSNEKAMFDLVAGVENTYGQIDLFCSNAGIGEAGGIELPAATWQQSWEVNVMAHVYAARAALPNMLARGRGYLLQTVSAAGLLTNLGAGPYSVTKHAALGLAEWLSVTYGAQGITVSCLCPQFVDTDLLSSLAPEEKTRAWAQSGMLRPDDIAKAVVAGLAAETFLILPHGEVIEYFRRKAKNYDGWLTGMRRLQDSVLPIIPDPAARDL